ncbi:hypothetical protein Tco_1508593 [Tanacetum coccineum]
MSSVEPALPVPLTTEPASLDEQHQASVDSAKNGKMLESNIIKKNYFVLITKKSILGTPKNSKQTPVLKLGQGHGKSIIQTPHKMTHRRPSTLYTKSDYHQVDWNYETQQDVGKQVHESHKAKNMVSTTKCLEHLHMNLFGPSAVQSYGGNFYTLVIVDDYSSARPCCFNNLTTSSPPYQPLSSPSDYILGPPPTTPTSQTSIPHLSPTSNNDNLLLTPKSTPPPLTSPPPAPTQPSKLTSPLAINLDPIELLFSTPPTSPQAFLDSLEDLPPATTNPPPPRPSFDTIERLANEPPPIPPIDSSFPSPTPDMEPPIPPFPPQCSPNPPSNLPPLPPLGPNNPFPMLTHEMFCEHCQRTQAIVDNFQGEVLTKQGGEKEAKNIDIEIALEKKVIELDIIKAQQIRPMLYDGNVIVMETNVISNADSEETLMLEEECRSKMLLKQSDPMINLSPQQELSDEQASHPNTDQSASSLVKIEAPRELPKMEAAVQQDHEGKAELIKQHNMVEKHEYNKLSKSYSQLDQHCISLELAMQLNQEIFQKNYTSVNQSEPTFDQLFEMNNLKAKLQAKDTTIEKLKANIKRLNKTSTTNSVKKDIDEIETINIQLEHRVAKMIAKNEHLKQTYKQLYDSIKTSCVHAKEHSESLVNQLNQKSIEITDLYAQLQEKVFVITSLKMIFEN